MAVIGKKMKKKNSIWKNESREVENEIQLESTSIQKIFHFNLAEFIFLKQIFI